MALNMNMVGIIAFEYNNFFLINALSVSSINRNKLFALLYLTLYLVVLNSKAVVK